MRLLLLCCFVVVHAVALDEMRMADRMYINRSQSVSMRFPYEFYLRDPYAHEIAGIIRGEDGTKKKIRYRFIYKQRSDIPADLDHSNPDRLIEWLVGYQFDTYLDYDYYREDPGTPHRHRAWAPSGVTARLGFTDDHEMILFQYDDRIIALEIRGKDPINERVVNSFEILKSVPRRKNDPDGEQVFMTWMQYQTRSGYAIIGPGEKESLAKLKRPQRWSDAYELETEHFHITTTCTPKYIRGRAKHLEEMYHGLRAWLPCEQSVNLKYEVHVTKTQDEFGEIGDFLYGDINRMFNVRKNSTLGGFFHPTSRALYTFTDKVKNSRMDSALRLAHEFVHQYAYINSRYNMSMPGWLNEALATFFENGFKSDSYRQVVPATLRIKLLKQIYKQRGFLGDMEKYVKGYGIGDVHQYAEAYAILHYLLHKEGGQQRLHDFWLAYRQRNHGVQAFYQQFVVPELGAEPTTDTYQRWEQTIERYVQTGRAGKSTTKSEVLTTAKP